MLNVYTRLPKPEWIVSNNMLKVGFPNEHDLSVIIYSFSIRNVIKSIQINYDP